MYLPSAFELLRCWEQGLYLPVHRRALLLLQMACPHGSAEDLARLSIGRRDAMLLRLRESLFGPVITSQGICPNCSEKLELSFSIRDVLVDKPDDDIESFVMNVENHDVIFRLPNSLDLDAVVSQQDDSPRRNALFRRCIISLKFNGAETTSDRIPTAIAESIEARMSQLDPQANSEIDLSCPGCQQRWLAPFDVAPFLWSEISAWARRMLQEVHVLARAYGWSEQQILALHPVKRQAYLQMVCG